MAAYCSDTGKAFFITVSKETRDIWIRETDKSGARKVDGKFPKDLLGREHLGKNGVLFLSAHIGEGAVKYTIFLSAKDRRCVWTIAIDVPKTTSGLPRMVKLDNHKFVYRNLHFEKPFYFGKGINPHSITALRGNYVKHAKPQDDESMETQEDDEFRYWLLYDLLPGWMSVIQLFSLLFFDISFIAHDTKGMG